MAIAKDIIQKESKVETSVFAVMSRLAEKYAAVNLSQGFPDFAISEALIDRVTHYMKSGWNQYSPMPGAPQLRKAISVKVEKEHGRHYDPDKEITITAGATQALYTAIAALVGPGDEVIVFEPVYDAYVPVVKMHGGKVKYHKMELPAFRINWENVARQVNSRTRMIIINTPHNPGGAVLEQSDLEALQEITRNTGIIVLSDEVYEHLVFDGRRHQSVCRFSELAERSLAVGSFGKTLHATGWKTGYVLAPEFLMREFRNVHQWVVFAVNTPVQMAIADFISNENNYKQLSGFYQEKRDLFLKLIQASRFRTIPCHGTYFQCLDYSQISNDDDMTFAESLVKKYGIASIPLSSFYQHHDDNHVLRFCFAKRKDTLEKAADILCRI